SGQHPGDSYQPAVAGCQRPGRSGSGGTCRMSQLAPTDLAAWLRRLESLHPSEIDMGLARVAEVASRLGVQRPAPLVFTVTGTNGKGSTCAALDSLLRHSGRRSGCYTSPHLVRYNERVTIDGEPVDDASLCQAFADIEQARGDISLTYF